MRAILTFEVAVEIPDEYQEEARSSLGEYYCPSVIAESSIITEALNHQKPAFELIVVEIN